MAALWFAIEAVHFLLGALGCAAFPDVVVRAYSLTARAAADTTCEFLRVLASFYCAAAALAAAAYAYPPVLPAAAVAFSALYTALIAADVFDWMLRRGYAANPARYSDTAIHVLFGGVHWAIALGWC
jgi:hypothetical protein